MKVHPSTEGVKFRRPICPKGHDKRKVGIDANYRCSECAIGAKYGYSHRVRRMRARANPRSLRYAVEIPNLEVVRRSFGLDSAQFASLAGVHQSTIRRYERGLVRATPGTAKKVIEAVRSLQRGVQELKGEG